MVAATTEKKEEREKKLTLLGHLQEIRRRLIYCTLFLIATVAVSWIFTNRIIKFLEEPAHKY